MLHANLMLTYMYGLVISIIESEEVCVYMKSYTLNKNLLVLKVFWTPTLSFLGCRH